MGAARKLTAAQAAELERLIISQAADAKGDRTRLRARRREVRESDLPDDNPDSPLTLEGLAVDTRPEPADLVVMLEDDARDEARHAKSAGPFFGRRYRLVGLAPWGVAVTQYDASGPCPVCGGRPGRRVYCLACDASGAVPQSWPQRDPDAGRLWDGKRDGYLAGGIGGLSVTVAQAWRAKLAQQARKAKRAAAAKPSATKPSAKKPTNKVRVRLVTAFKGWQAGEVVEIRPAMAEAYIKAGVAELVRENAA